MSERVLKEVGTARQGARLCYVPVVRCSLIRERSQGMAARVLRNDTDAAVILRDVIGESDREMLVALLLDIKGAVTGVHVVSIGTMTESLACPRELFRAAILSGAASVILGHNHPSGDPSPSPEDVATTTRIEEAGKLLGITLLDHVILGEGQHVSLKLRGLVTGKVMR